MKIDFEQYLQAEFFKLNPQVLDDEMGDKFDEWLGDENVDDIILFAQDYAEKVFKEVMEIGTDLLKEKYNITEK